MLTFSVRLIKLTMNNDHVTEQSQPTYIANGNTLYCQRGYN